MKCFASRRAVADRKLLDKINARKKKLVAPKRFFTRPALIQETQTQFYLFLRSSF